MIKVLWFLILRWLVGLFRISRCGVFSVVSSSDRCVFCLFDKWFILVFVWVVIRLNFVRCVCSFVGVFFGCLWCRCFSGVLLMCNLFI